MRETFLQPLLLSFMLAIYGFSLPHYSAITCVSVSADQIDLTIQEPSHVKHYCEPVLLLISLSSGVHDEAQHIIVWAP